MPLADQHGGIFVHLVNVHGKFTLREVCFKVNYRFFPQKSRGYLSTMILMSEGGTIPYFSPRGGLNGLPGCPVRRCQLLQEGPSGHARGIAGCVTVYLSIRRQRQSCDFFALAWHYLHADRRYFVFDTCFTKKHRQTRNILIFNNV